MKINLKNFLSTNKRTSKMGDFQEIKHIEGLQVSSVSADLYRNERDDLSIFYFPNGSNYAVAYTKIPLFQSQSSGIEKIQKIILKH